MDCKYAWDSREACSNTAVSGSVNEVCVTHSFIGNNPNSGTESSCSVHTCHLQVYSSIAQTSCAEEIMAKIHTNNKNYALSITTTLLNKSHATNSHWCTGPFPKHILLVLQNFSSKNVLSRNTAWKQILTNAFTFQANT